VALAKNNV
jgi:hypothetical protein